MNCTSNSAGNAIGSRSLLLIKHHADTYHRAGISHPWPVPEEPVVIGFEGVGIVEGTGDGVTNFKIGDRVAYGIPPLGSYSEIRNYPEDKLLHLPSDLDDKQVASLLMKGMTAHYLLHRTYAVKPGDTILEMQLQVVWV